MTRQTMIGRMTIIVRRAVATRPALTLKQLGL
jgi:hypothetical protein